MSKPEEWAGENRLPLQDRIKLDLIEADIEMGFRLLETSGAVGKDEDAMFATRATESAEEVCRDIEQRLARLQESAREPFMPLVAELRREIESARRQWPETHVKAAAPQTREDTPAPR
jgi:hypothetical protein